MSETVTARYFCTVLAANVDYSAMSDADFRDLVRNTLPVVDYQLPETPETVAITLEGEFEVIARPDGRYDVLADHVVRHPGCNEHSVIGALVNYLNSTAYTLNKIRKALL